MVEGDLKILTSKYIGVVMGSFLFPLTAKNPGEDQAVTSTTKKKIAHFPLKLLLFSSTFSKQFYLLKCK